ncbi:zinc metalloproteinase nas-8 [Trichonephila clavipes]|nr:zinc metalloproteinase nas-8 [Trichonephila clavipes]
MNWDQGSQSIPRKTSQTIIPPPPNFTVAPIHSDKSISPNIRQAQTLPSNWNAAQLHRRILHYLLSTLKMGSGHGNRYCPEEDNGCFPIISLVNNESKRFEVILHELMHSLGFHHEHSRPDRNLYLWIFWDNIDPDSLSQFRMLSYDDYQWNDFEMDYQSIMMYPSLSYSKNGLITIFGKDGQFIGQNMRLSFLDKIKLSLL